MTMKRFIRTNVAAANLVLAVIAGFAGVAGAATADPMWTPAFKPYVGIDWQHNSVDYSSNYNLGGFGVDGDKLLEDELNGVDVHVGDRFLKNFGVELGYFRMFDADKNVHAGDSIGNGVVAATNFKTTVQEQGVTLDGLGYLPVAADQKFELIGTAGVTWTAAKLKLNIPGTGSGDEDKSEFGFRIGGGAQYALTDRLNARGLVRYQTADFDGVANNTVTYTLGLNYGF